MKVEESPITILSEPARDRITIITGGIRIAMSGDEASSFWTQLGNVLKATHAQHLERCPPNLPLAPRHDRAAASDPALELERVVAYAHRAGMQPNGFAGSPSLGTDPKLEPPRPLPSVLGRALGKLAGR